MCLYSHLDLRTVTDGVIRCSQSSPSSGSLVGTSSHYHHMCDVGSPTARMPRVVPDDMWWRKYTRTALVHLPVLALRDRCMETIQASER